MIQIKEKKDCCGCSACGNICPRKCISMEKDEEGFLYPSIAFSRCIDCGLCEKVCPVLNPVGINTADANAFAAVNLDCEYRKRSSSGGIFALLAQDVLKMDGIVFGAAMANDNKSVVHIGICSEEELWKLMGSKYVQSEIGNAYQQAKKALEKGIKVLFSGTPCQINGLKLYLQREYANLILVDIICHGCPSPELWKKYISDFESRHHSTISLVSFRYKKSSWKNYSIRQIDDRGHEIITPYKEHPFMRMFARNYSLRESCYQCPAKTQKCADLTLGDFWGINRVAPEMNDEMGTSLVLIRTEKGKAAFEAIQDRIKMKSVRYEDAVKGNMSEYKSVLRPQQRDSFFHDMNTISFKKLKRKYAADSAQIKIFIKKCMNYVRNG